MLFPIEMLFDPLTLLAVATPALKAGITSPITMLSPKVPEAAAADMVKNEFTIPYISTLPVTLRDPVSITLFVVFSNVNVPDPEVVLESLNCIVPLEPPGVAEATTPVKAEPSPLNEPVNADAVTNPCTVNE